jgi:hypothetical protein
MKVEECGIGPAHMAKNANAETGKCMDIGAHKPRGALPLAVSAALVPTKGVVGFKLISVAEKAATAKPRVEVKAQCKLKMLP